MICRYHNQLPLLGMNFLLTYNRDSFSIADVFMKNSLLHKKNHIRLEYLFFNDKNKQRLPVVCSICQMTYYVITDIFSGSIQNIYYVQLHVRYYTKMKITNISKIERLAIVIT